MDPYETVDRIDAALTATAAVVSGIGEHQWEAGTPCPDWDVRALTNHLVGGLRIYTAELTGAEPGKAHEDDWLGADPAGEYADAARRVRTAWRAPGAMDAVLHLSVGPVPAPMAAVIQLTEVVVHGLDLAVATGQEERIDQPQAAALLTLMEGMGVDAFRVPGVFGPPRTAPGDAPAHLRLLAFLGRDVRPAAAVG